MPAELARRQLDAYNHHDLDAFCACYHPDVLVLDDEEVSLRGLDAFRERYAPLFARGQFGADVPRRVHHGAHVVDLERWWREDPATGERAEGELLVRYTVRDGLIAVVQFLR